MQLSLSIGYGNYGGRYAVAIDYQHDQFHGRAAPMVCAFMPAPEVAHCRSVCMPAQPSMQSEAASVVQDGGARCT